ncbi:hypothetical protein CPB86DRAFT_137795 [Serendipita vermifera]|nr:hypothetical protein CPB86DRAFT_137795 [Serendipita vermifera]
MSHKPQLPAPFKSPGALHGNPAVPFPNESSIWEVYINESIVVDNELVKDWTSSLNFLLIFAAIFSSVLSAFIIESKKLLERDPADVMVDALIFFINNAANGTQTPYTRTSFSPEPYAVSVNCLFFASLTASIVAALASVVSLQWVAEYDAAVSRSGSSPEGRVKRRQFRYGGMEKWKMQEIIAVLPVLLYCSLILFFVGLAQWMWSVHKTVGCVVMGGALLGAIFYVITTMLAVIFPSSPYRAPIVRWIYLLFHLILRPFTRPRQHSSDHALTNGVKVQKTSFKDKIRSTIAKTWQRASTFPGSVIRFLSRFENLTTQGRDQAYIGCEQKQLVSNSLAWVAQNLSISRDSHRRLLFLVQEFLKLETDQWSSKSLREVPWSLIINSLASEYAQCAASRKLTEDDEKELVVLFYCLQRLQTGKLGGPGDQWNILHNLRALSGPEGESFDPIHLLFHEIGVSDAPISIEAQIGLRIWYLNQLHYLSQSIQEIQAMHKEIISRGISHIHDYLLPRLSHALAERAHDDAQDRVDNLISLMHLNSPALLDPSSMASFRREWIPVVRPSLLIQRLDCVMWIRFQTGHPHIHDVLSALLVTQNRNLDILPLWSLSTTDEEVATTSTLVDAQNRQKLLPLIDRERKDSHMDAIIQAFDNLITQGCHDEQRGVLIGLICNGFRNSRSLLPADYFNSQAKWLLNELRDPWIRFIVYLAAGMNEQLDHFCMHQHSWLPETLVDPLSQYILDPGYFINSFSARRVQMRWWSRLARNKTRAIITQALTDLETLDRLRAEFTNSNLGVEDGGDYLLEIIHSPYSLGHYAENRSWRMAFCGFIPALLSRLDWESYLETYFKLECVSRLLEFAEDVKRHPRRLISLLIKLARASYQPNFPGPYTALNLYYMVTVIEGYCTSENTRPHITGSHELAHALIELRDAVVAQWSRVLDENETCPGDRTRLGDKDAFSARCTRAIHGLLTPSPTAFGIQASRSLSCARPLIVANAAIGWLGIHDGERPRPHVPMVPDSSKFQRMESNWRVGL